MEDFLLVNEPDPSVLSILKQYYTQTNGNNGGDDGDYDTFCLHSKASTLRSIRNRTANCSVTDGIIESLILIDELDRRRGAPPSDAMREAFCAVAVHRTLWWLPVSWDDYCDAVRRIWGKQIADLELSGASGLLSTGLSKWGEEIEAALWDPETAKRLLLINTLDEALRLIRVYLKEASRSMNHAFRHLPGHPTADDVAPVPAPTEGNGISMVNSQTRCDPSSSSRHYERPAVIADREEDRPSCRKYVSLSSPEIDKVRDTLKSSVVDLAANVDDPLPKALEIAERIVSYVAAAKKMHSEGDGNMEQGAPDETIRKDHERMDWNVPAPSADHTAEPSQDKKGNGAFIRPNKVRRTGLMERNDTARTFEWEDSIDDSSEETDSFSNRCTLPSPRTKHVSPLNIDEPKRWGRRRQVNRWTHEEEKALTEGVQKYGNQWARILETYKEIFRERKSVDLKDKWRNLLRK